MEGRGSDDRFQPSEPPAHVRMDEKSPRGPNDDDDGGKQGAAGADGAGETILCDYVSRHDEIVLTTKVGYDIAAERLLISFPDGAVTEDSALGNGEVVDEFIGALPETR